MAAAGTAYLPREVMCVWRIRELTSCLISRWGWKELQKRARSRLISGLWIFMYFSLFRVSA